MIIPAGFAQVNLGFTGPAAPTGAEVTFGIEQPTLPLSPSQVAQLVGQAMLDSGVMGEFSTQVTCSTIEVKFGPNSTGASGGSTPGIAGGNAGGAAAPNTALLVQKRTDLGGRAGKGRFYWPGWVETNIDNSGFIPSVPLALVQTDMAAFLTELAGADLPMVLLHSAGSPLAVPTPVVELLVPNLVATQRQRLRR